MSASPPPEGSRTPVDTIWYHLYPLGFLGAERVALPPGAPPVPRLLRLDPWLDHAATLGCTGLVLGPVFESETHGYDTVDHYAVDRRLGTDADLQWLIDAAHDRGLNVVLDGVFNHVGRGFGPLADALARGAAAPTKDWFLLRRGSTWDDPASVRLRCFEGHDRLVTLNHGHPGVVDHVAGVMTHWLDRGIDGWRLDAAYAVPLPFWREVTDRVRATHPQAWLMGEVIHGDYGQFVTEGGLSTVTQYELWKATWSALNDANFFELTWALERHDALLSTFVPATFVGNHDVTRLASTLRDPRHVAHAVVVMCTVAGTPSVYAGDEWGFRGVKEHREGGDDAVRPAFPDEPAAVEPPPDGPEILDAHRRLLHLRLANPWLTTARTHVCERRNEAMSYETACGEERLVAALSVAHHPVALRLPPGRWGVRAGSAEVRERSVTLAPHGWAVLTPG